MTLEMSKYPEYCAAVRDERFVSTIDAQHDPATAELAHDYLVPHGITSMLDAAIYREGQVIGVVCLEHVGPPRNWLPQEHQFAASVADLVAYFQELEERLEAERRTHALELETRDRRHQAVVSRLAAGVGHDLNNLISVISGGVAVLERHLPEAQRPMVAMMASAIEQSAALSRQLVSLGRPAGSGRVLLTAETLRERLGSGARGLISKPWELAFDLAPGTTFWAEPTQLEQVLLNLIGNARDAMPEGGTVLVRLHPGGDERGRPESVLEVIDTGQGMSKSQLEHLGEPFFTTKPKGRGTGLGVATVQLLAGLHDARVNFESAVGEGTTVRVCWPAQGR